MDGEVVKYFVMRFKDYFIWEKSQWNNRGISIKLKTSPYCYIKPTMCSTWSDFDKRSYFDKPYDHYLFCQEKTIFWLWFRLTFKINIEKKHTIQNESSAEDLFNMIPPFLNIDGELYHFEMMQGKHGYKITYKKNDSEGGETLKIGEAYKLVLLLNKMVCWLYEFDYVQYMPYGYKEKYETMFKTKIEHSREFDK